MLAEALEEQPSAQVLFNHRIVHFTQDEAGLEIHVETPTEIETIKADYLIGTDGASSIVRKWLGTEFDGFTYPEKFLCLTTDVPLEDTLKGLTAVNYVSDPDEWLVLLRVPSMWRVLLPANDESNEHLTSDAKKNDVFKRLIHLFEVRRVGQEADFGTSQAAGKLDGVKISREQRGGVGHRFEGDGHPVALGVVGHHQAEPNRLIHRLFARKVGRRTKESAVNPKVSSHCC